MSNLDTIIEELSSLSIENSNNPLTDSIDNSKKLLQVPLITKEEVKDLSNRILSSFTMPQFKPEYLQCVPQFDGNPNDLNRYLTTCQSLIDNFYNVSNPLDFQNTFLLNSLIGKLSGTAKIVVNIQNISTWEDLKSILHRNFADQRDEACLNRDLVMLRQNQNENPNQFYDRVLHLLNLLCSYIDCHESSDGGKMLKKSLYNDLALKTFLSGLKEPIGTTIRCMKPRSLAEALQYVTQEYNNHYFQNMSNRLPHQSTQVMKTNSKPQANHFNQQFRMPFVAQPQQNFASFNAQTPHNLFMPRSNFNRFPSQPINIRPNFNRMPQRFPTNSQVFGRPNQSNVFKPNQNKSLPAPQPMSVCTSGPKGPLSQYNRFPRPNFQGNSQNFQGNFQNNQPKYLVEELYSAETQSNSNYDQFDQYALPEACVDPEYANINNMTNYYEYNPEYAEYSYSQETPENPTFDNECDSVSQEKNINFSMTPQKDNPT